MSIMESAKSLKDKWFHLIEVLGEQISKPVLMVVYFTVFLCVSSVMKLFGHKFINSNKDENSDWEDWDYEGDYYKPY